MDTTTQLPPKLADTLELLSLVDRAERIDILIGIADRFQGVPDTIAERPYGDDHKVPACESEAFVWAQRQADGTPKFYFAVENPQGISAMAMAVILDESLSGHDPAQVAAVPQDIVYEIFGRELSMGKSMGLMGMVAMVKHFGKRLAAGGDG